MVENGHAILILMYHNRNNEDYFAVGSIEISTLAQFQLTEKYIFGVSRKLIRYAIIVKTSFVQSVLGFRFTAGRIPFEFQQSFCFSILGFHVYLSYVQSYSYRPTNEVCLGLSNSGVEYKLSDRQGILCKVNSVILDINRNCKEFYNPLQIRIQF